ncbi:C-reactive protein-like [Pocillopora verrucosa]|uniref:C-reactive protein-like n=1 Tax=Pocillopora verrucosa TaxID=203993 RepID=UPI003341F99C
MGLENTSLFVFFRGVILLYVIFHAGVESSALSRSTYFTTLTNKRLKGFVVKRFKSTSQIWCSQSCLKNAWCTSTNFKLTPQTSKSDGKGTCELNKHDVIKENTHLQFEAEVIFSTLIKDCRLAASTCLNGGVCFYDEKKQTYSCECKPPWTGETCADLFTCDSHPCKNNGTCTDELNGYNCSCAPGFYGTHCEKIEGLSCSSAYRMVFGQPTNKSYASITNATSSSLSEFTMCLFAKMKDTNLSNEQCLYSYATIGAPYGNAFYVCMLSPRIRISIDTLGKDDIDSGVKINDTMWHHVCVAWKNTKGDWQLYLDGQLKSNGTDFKKNHQIPAGGTVVIGQDQDKVGGGFEIKDSFGPGEVTEVNLWSRVLSGDEIAAQTANCDIAKAGLVLWWLQFKGNVTTLVIVEP